MSHTLHQRKGDERSPFKEAASQATPLTEEPNTTPREKEESNSFDEQTSES